MPYIIVIDKTGTVKETNIKEYKEADLYKKANFKSAEGFALQTTWTGLSLSSGSSDKSEETITVSVYGKKAGKAGQENKYEFPPPIDSVLFFGGCVLVAESEVEGSICDLRISSWNKIYDTLMGGFEDLDQGEDREEQDEDDEEDVDPNLIGKNGYMKDGFVVEDDDVEFEDREEEEDLEEDLVEEEEEEKPKKKPKRKVVEKKNEKEKKKSEKKKKSMEKEGSTSDFSVAVTDNYLDCSSELVEEEYV